jgi:hypothetical protein
MGISYSSCLLRHWSRVEPVLLRFATVTIDVKLQQNRIGHTGDTAKRTGKDETH